MMSRGFGYSIARPDGTSSGISGTLRREVQGEYCGYSEVSV
jgi:hypothetical protein